MLHRRRRVAHALDDATRDGDVVVRGALSSQITRTAAMVGGVQRRSVKVLVVDAKLPSVWRFTGSGP